MDIKEILERPSPAVYTIEELEFAIGKYIEKKKNVKIKVNVHKDFFDIEDINPFGVFQLQNEYHKLFNAFEIVQQNYYK